MKKRIVVIDDAKAIREAARLFLSRDGFEVIEAEDGFSGIATVSAHHPDMVLLDVTMPRVSGYQVCMLLRGSQEFANLPIIMLTGRDSPYDMATGRLLGCTDYLVKPFSRDGLLQAVHKYLIATNEG